MFQVHRIKWLCAENRNVYCFIKNLLIKSHTDGRWRWTIKCYRICWAPSSSQASRRGDISYKGVSSELGDAQFWQFVVVSYASPHRQIVGSVNLHLLTDLQSRIMSEISLLKVYWSKYWAVTLLVCKKFYIVAVMHRSFRITILRLYLPRAMTEIVMFLSTNVILLLCIWMLLVCSYTRGSSNVWSRQQNIESGEINSALGASFYH